MDVNLKKEKFKLKLEEDMEIDNIQIGLNSLIISDKEFFENLDYGNIQYKLDLSKKSKIDWDKIINQVVYRLQEGNGECFFVLGLGDLGENIGLSEEELKESVENLGNIVFKLEANLKILKFYRGKVGLVAEIIIRKNCNFQNKKIAISEKTNFYEIKVGLFGEETSGKSTLVGVLVNGKMDNGEGSARQNIFRFQHEIQCGKTSSISHQLVGFDEKGNICNSTNWDEIMKNSSKVISLYDLGGSEKALKSTLSILSPTYIDIFFLVISAKQGITENTKLFLNLANFMNFSVITIITMTDLINQNEIEELIKNYKILIKNLKLKKNPLIVNSFDDITLFSRNLDENIYPIFVISNKSGSGLNFLINFLSLIPLINNSNILNKNISIDNLCQFDIHEHFVLDKEKESNGKLILGGIVSRGKVMVGHKYYLGPDKNGNFKIVEVNDIHCKKVSVKIAYEGQFSSLSVIKSVSNSNLKYEDIRKGMSLLDVDSSIPIACKSFIAEIWSIDENTRYVKYKYEPVVTIKHVRQSCKIKKIVNNINCETNVDNEELEEMYEDIKKNRRRDNKNSNDESYTISPNEKILLNFEFKNYPEFIIPGSRIIIHDNHLKAFGIILSIVK